MAARLQSKGGFMIKKILFFFLLILVLMILLTTSLSAQEKQFQGQWEVSRDSLLMYARMIVDSARCHALVTVDEDSKPHARQMAPFKPENDWTIWLGTFPTSRKAKQIKNNPNVVVFYYDTKGMSYVAVHGTASLINDPELKAKYWVESWKRYYPDTDTQYILIKVIPERLEICSYKYQLFWNDEGLPAIVELSEKK